MKHCIAWIFSLLLLSGCEVHEEPLPLCFEEMAMLCMDRVSMGGSLRAVVNTQEEYEQLIYQRFQKPLDDYWDKYYDSVLEGVKERHPGLSDEEYEELVRQVFYSALPFKGTDNCTHPEIDFCKYTLLGQDAHASGCRDPDYEIEVLKDRPNKEIIFAIRITTYGTCEKDISENKWVLIPKIPPSYTVVFTKEYIRE